MPVIASDDFNRTNSLPPGRRRLVREPPRNSGSFTIEIYTAAAFPDDHGTTGHIFFSYWDFNGHGGDYPTNICVTGNNFTRPHNPYWPIDMRSELDWNNDNIDVDPNTNTYDKPYSYTKLVDIDTSLRAC